MNTAGMRKKREGQGPRQKSMFTVQFMCSVQKLGYGIDLKMMCLFNRAGKLIYDWGLVKKNAGKKKKAGFQHLDSRGSGWGKMVGRTDF